MTVLLQPEVGIPLSVDMSYADLRVRAEAACNTSLLLADNGLNITPNNEDRDVAAGLAVEYAEDPEKTSKKTSNARIAKMTPASLVLTNSILQEFGQSVAESATQIRHLVTNKLLLESENPDPRVRIRALELLGKISDVSLFAEKSEVTITHQSTDDLRAKLRQKLEKLVNPPEELGAPIILDGEVIDVDAELGLTPEKPEIYEEYDDESEVALDFTEEEIQVMLDNLDDYTQDEVFEIDKLVEELSARKRSKLAYDDLIEFCKAMMPEFIVGNGN
jgi:hypothetical protein